jgi:hypothetical protein
MKCKTFQQGEIMKKSYLTAVLTLTCLPGLGISAHAQDVDGVVVTVPFEFVAGGATLPSGEYRVSRVSSGVNPALAIRSNKAGASLLPMVFDEVPGGQPNLSFEHVGGEYFLSKVETPEGVYAFGNRRATVALAQMKDQGTLSSSGTN